MDMEKALSCLSLKEKTVIRHRYGLGGRTPMTLQAIGDALGLTKERVRQIEANALKKLSKSKKVNELRVYLGEDEVVKSTDSEVVNTSGAKIRTKK